MLPPEIKLRIFNMLDLGCRYNQCLALVYATLTDYDDKGRCESILFDVEDEDIKKVFFLGKFCELRFTFFCGNRDSKLYPLNGKE